jgi:hypothetical protein
MAGGHFKRNHVASRCYLDAWTDDDGQLVVARRPNGETRRQRPVTVGYRNYFWGHHPEIRAAAERDIGRVETRSAPVLHALAERWPLERGSDEWFALLELVAVHAIRTPGWRERMVAEQEALIGRDAEKLRREFGEHFDDAVAFLRSDRQRVALLMGLIPKLASLLGSMHLTLLHFERPCLVTSDQPLTPVALLPAGLQPPIAAIPASGFLATREYRFPVGPRDALLLTWLDEPDDGPAIRGNYRLACDLNFATARQSDREFFHHPDAVPPFVAPPDREPRSSPLGSEVHPQYSLTAATHSRRRLQAHRILNEMIENQIIDRIEVVSVSRAAA